MLFIRGHKVASSNRLDTLSKIFAILAISWLLCEGPHVISTLLEYPLWALSGCTDNFFHNCNSVYCTNVNDRLSAANQITLMLKNLFPVVNTVLLILLMRPLQEPILRCFKLCRRQKSGWGLPMRLQHQYDLWNCFPHSSKELHLYPAEHCTFCLPSFRKFTPSFTWNAYSHHTCF